jgi:hypothetical protein
MTKEHRFRITIEHLSAPDGDVSSGRSLQFETGSHDDIIGVVQRLRTRGDLPEDDAAALGVGLKHFGGVMLAHREHVLFAAIRPAFGEFMKVLKAGARKNDDS